jgi:hypothetical protein
MRERRENRGERERREERRGERERERVCVRVYACCGFTRHLLSGSDPLNA